MSSPVRPVVVGLGEILWDLLPGGRVLGGAPANFAYHANALGARGIVVSAVGSDALGREILTALGSAGLSTAYLAIDENHPTGTVTVELASGGAPRFTIHTGVAWDHQAFTPQLAELARTASAVCFGTLAQRTPSNALTIRDFLDAAAPGSVRVFDVNLRQSFYSRAVILESLARADILKLNDEELPVLAELLGLPGAEGEALLALLEGFGLSMVALTKGAKGSLLRTPSEVSRMSPEPVTVVDSVGAGDAFTAAVVLGVLQKLPIPELHQRASRIASYVCTQQGATPPLPDPLINFSVS